jgi:putative transposase
MARTRYTAEEIIGQLWTIEIELGKGLAVVEACRKLGITEQTYYRWKKEYGGLRVDQAKRLKALEQENARLLDGMNLNQELVKQGWSWWNGQYAPRDVILEELETRARASTVIWAGLARNFSSRLSKEGAAVGQSDRHSGASLAAPQAILRSPSLFAFPLPNPQRDTDCRG